MFKLAKAELPWLNLHLLFQCDLHHLIIQSQAWKYVSQILMTLPSDTIIYGHFQGNIVTGTLPSKACRGKKPRTAVMQKKEWKKD